MVVIIKVVGYWVVTPPSFVGAYWHFGATFRLHLQGWNI
jgi:hypothetical protein